MKLHGGLLERWSSLSGDLPAVTMLGARLVAAWSEGHRCYHTLRHLTAVLDRIDELDPQGRDRRALDGDGRATVSGSARVAAWYHDVVYRPGSAGNEAASAALARATLPALGWDRVGCDEVARLVMLTVDHGSDPSDRAGALLCDADLAVLGGDTAGYDAYVEAVRAEYSATVDPAWRAGRATVLRSLLARDRLYATSEGARRWEAAARRNLDAELQRLDR